MTEEWAEKVRSNLEILRNLPLACEARQLLEADIYARAEVLSEAIPAYRKALARKEAPESRITLGDSYLVIGLLRSADRQYRSALESSQEPGIHAAAELGLGKLESVRRNPARAAEHFKKARDLYDFLGLKAESAAVSRALEEASKQQ